MVPHLFWKNCLIGLGLLFGLQDRDLSPVTDDLWRKCYGRQFGNDAMNMVKERMSNRGTKFKWRQLYQVVLQSEAGYFLLLG